MVLIESPFRSLTGPLLAYIDALTKMPRLIVIDNIGLTPGGSEGSAGTGGGGPTGNVFAGVGAVPTLQAQLTGRLFAQNSIGLAAGTTGSAGGVGSGATTSKTPTAGGGAPTGVQNG